MSEIAKTIGFRIRNYRTQKGLSQEKLAEAAGCHPTYIGQIERGEKNATLESIEKISSAMCVPLSKLFEKIGMITLTVFPQNAMSLSLQKANPNKNICIGCSWKWTNTKMNNTYKKTNAFDIIIESVFNYCINYESSRKIAV